MEDRIEQLDSDYEYPDEDEDDDLFEKENPFRSDTAMKLNSNHSNTIAPVGNTNTNNNYNNNRNVNLDDNLDDN